MYCSRCGHQNPDGVGFCVACGAAMQGTKQGGSIQAQSSSTPTSQSLPNIFFMDFVLRKLSDGSFFRLAVVTTMCTGAIILAITAILLWLKNWRFVVMLNDFAGEIGFIGGTLSQLIFLVAIYMSVHAVIFRAREIAKMEHSEFTLIPITSVLTNLQGDLSAIVWVTFGIVGWILLWFAGPAAEVLGLVGGFGSAYGSFLGGVLVLVGGLLLAFISLLFFYFLSECILVTAAIARNTEAIRRASEQQYASTGPGEE